MIELKGLPQPPERRAFNPKKRGDFGKIGPISRPFNPKRRGFFGKIGKIKRPKKARPQKTGKQFGPKYQPGKRFLSQAKYARLIARADKRSLRVIKTKKPRGSTRRARQSTARGGFRRHKQSWLLKMAMAALKRSMKSPKPRDFRNHGYKGITKRGRTGLGGR